MASLWIKLDSHNLVTQVYTDIVKPTVGNLRKKWNEIAGSGRFNFESFPFFAGKSVSNIQKKKKNESKKKRKRQFHQILLLQYTYDESKQDYVRSGWRVLLPTGRLRDWLEQGLM